MFIASAPDIFFLRLKGWFTENQASLGIVLVLTQHVISSFDFLGR
jgi:hypothetical protein